MFPTRSRALRALATLVPILALVALPAALPAADLDFGVRAGGYLEDADPFVGIELLMPLGPSDWYFNPNIEAVFSGERDRLSGSADFHYDFRQTADYYLWAGAGLAVIHVDSDRTRDSETELGANLLFGIGWRLRDFTPYAQLKVVAADDSQVVAAVGIRF